MKIYLQKKVMKQLLDDKKLKSDSTMYIAGGRFYNSNRPVTEENCAV